MITDFFSSMFGPITIYIRFSPQLIHIHYAEKNQTIEEKPIIALCDNKKKKRQVVAVGNESAKIQAQDPAKIQIYNAFKHPRTFLSHFELAEATLRYFICKIGSRKIMLRPIIILHPTENLQGGITQIEYKALIELGVSIGGRQVFVWTGRPLTNKELLDTAFLKKHCAEPPNNPL